jgi:HPt (histidine-containing phosphotransfer) domain-containing protein
MPAMDGYEATRRVRESGNSRLPIIGMTAHTASGDRERCMHAGMNGFLSKPVDLEVLAAVLAKWLPAPEPRVQVQSAEPAAAQLSPAIFDSEALLKRLLGDRQLAGTIVEGFCGTVPAQLSNLRQRFVEGDRTGARSQAHALKGSAATVSASALAAIAREMERTAAAGRLDRFGELLPQAAEAFERFRSVLERTGWLSP